MNVLEQIDSYISCQTEVKRNELLKLHKLILDIKPSCKLWFLDGKDDTGKTVSNPNIGYGIQTLKYKDGKTKTFYQIGLSANTTGISVYIIGIEDKKLLAENFGKEIGKASISGYCIKFKTLEDIDIETLEAVIKFGFENTNKKV